MNINVYPTPRWRLSFGNKALQFGNNTPPATPSNDFPGFTKAPLAGYNDNDYLRIKDVPRVATPTGLKRKLNTDIYYRVDPRGFVELTNKGREKNDYFLHSATWDNLMETPASRRPHITIFDVGAGRGAMVDQLRTMGFNAFGIDKFQHGTNILQHDIAQLTSDTYRNQFDYITSVWSVFSYDDTPDSCLHDPDNTLQFQRESLQKMADWLKPGGKILVSPVRESRFLQVLEDVPSLNIEEIWNFPVNPDLPEHVQNEAREKRLFVLTKANPPKISSKGKRSILGFLKKKKKSETA